MISDVLSDAKFEIERYLKDQPEMYAGMELEIRVALAAMEKVRVTLDVYPSERDTDVAPNRQ